MRRVEKEENDQVEELFVKEKSILQNALVNSPEDGKTIMQKPVELHDKRMATQEGNEKHNKDVRKQTNELKDKISSGPETKSTEEDSFIQITLNGLQAECQKAIKISSRKSSRKQELNPF